MWGRVCIAQSTPPVKMYVDEAGHARSRCIACFQRHHATAQTQQLGRAWCSSRECALYASVDRDQLTARMGGWVTLCLALSARARALALPQRRHPFGRNPAQSGTQSRFSGARSSMIGASGFGSLGLFFEPFGRPRLGLVGSTGGGGSAGSAPSSDGGFGLRISAHR